MLSKKIRKIATFIALSAYMAVGVGMDSVLAMCFEQNGDIVIEEMVHGEAALDGGPGNAFYVKILDSGVPFPLETSNDLHKDQRVAFDSTAGSKVIVGNLAPTSNILLYTISNPPHDQFAVEENSVVDGRLQPPPLVLITRETTVLQL